MSEFGDTIPYTVGNNTIDLSAQLEKQLNDQMSDDPLDMQEEENKNKTDNTEKPELHTVDLKTVDIKREVKKEFPDINIDKLIEIITSNGLLKDDEKGER